MEIIKVIIVDDHIIFRQGLKIILNEIDNIKVVGDVQNGHELLELLKKQDTDIIFMDIKMPKMNGVESTKKVRKKYPDIKIIALTMFEEISYFNQMVEAGACGFLLKKTSSEELERAINLVLNDEPYFAEEFISSAKKYLKPTTLKTNITITEREKEVLELICKGFSNVEIAKTLGISTRTVDGFKAKLFEKTGAKNAPNLVLFAIKNQLVNI